MNILSKFVQLFFGALIIALGIFSISIANDATGACVVVLLGSVIMFAGDPDKKN